MNQDVHRKDSYPGTFLTKIMPTPNSGITNTLGWMDIKSFITELKYGLTKLI